jgi:hypothetical protein
MRVQIVLLLYHAVLAVTGLESELHSAAGSCSISKNGKQNPHVSYVDAAAFAAHLPSFEELVHSFLVAAVAVYSQAA